MPLEITSFAISVINYLRIKNFNEKVSKMVHYNIRKATIGI